MHCYQQVIPDTPHPFSLTKVLLARGIRYPLNRDYIKLRNYLRNSGYSQFKIAGRDELWIRDSTITPEYREQMHKNLPPEIWTLESYARHHFRIAPPFTPEIRLRVIEAMRKAGYVRRGRPGQPEYWSPRLARRQPERRPLARPNVPNRPRYPEGTFSRLDFLRFNNLPRYPENLKWASAHLADHCTAHKGKWVMPDRRGHLPATVTGQWLAPGEVFTTAEFQRFNNARQVTADQWRGAMAWLAANGYHYDAGIRRWIS